MFGKNYQRQTFTLFRTISDQPMLYYYYYYYLTLEKKKEYIPTTICTRTTLELDACLAHPEQPYTFFINSNFPINFQHHLSKSE